MVSDEEKAAQLVFPGFKFGIDDPAEAASWVELGVGGFCLYGGQVREVTEFIAAMQAKAKIPLLFAADYEDGVASQSPGGTRLPTNMAVGASGDETLAFEKGEITAAQARALGVRWVFAPVVDLATQPQNPIVNVRAFSDDAALTIRLARAYLDGLAAKKVLGCLKHFPGHGETLQDSHLDLPRVGVERARLLAREAAPFRALLSRAGAVMTAHMIVPAIEPDEQVPISLSGKAVAFLRRELNFDGLISTDALTMHAISRRFPEAQAAEMALLAGSDVLLVPEAPRKLLFEAQAWMENGGPIAARINEAWTRLDRVKESLGLYADRGAGDFSALASPEHEARAGRMAEKCLAWAGKPAALPKSVAYLEPGAESPEEWQGRAFIAELRAQGVEVRPDQGAAGSALLVASFMRPQAYSGRIAFESETVAQVRAAIARAQSSLLAAFGSPFVAADFQAGAALCAFSTDEHAQRAAARALAGQIPVTGKLPIRG